MKDKDFFLMRGQVPKKVKCSKCKHFCKKEKRCYPDDPDAAPYYDLSDNDIHKGSYCDFFEKK